LPVKKTFYNISSVQSAANIVFLAGDNRYAVPYSTFMMHGVNFPLNMTVDREQLDSLNSGFAKNEETILNIVTDRTKLTAVEVKALFHQGRTEGAQWALDQGVIEGFQLPIIPDFQSHFVFQEVIPAK
jgi:ATP-dependent protease ClpP protease subunit